MPRPAIFLYITFYWNTTFVCSHTIHGCFHAVNSREEESGQRPDSPQSQKYLSPEPSKKHVLTPGLNGLMVFENLSWQTSECDNDCLFDWSFSVPHLQNLPGPGAGAWVCQTGRQRGKGGATGKALQDGLVPPKLHLFYIFYKILISAFELRNNL